jgi:carboxyl-terminal processing protease
MTKEKVRVQLTRHEWPDEKEARKKKTRRNILVTLSLILVFSFGFFSHDLINTNSTQTTQTEDEFTRLKAVYSVLVDEWFFGKDNADLRTQLIDDAILGMVESTGDIHTQYMSAQEVSQFTQSIDRGFVGIGVSYFESNGTYIVENVFIDSPADKAGVQSGDIIWKVDGVDTATIDSNTLVDLVRGEEGTIVKIEFKRGDELVNLDITRGPINNTAYGKMLDSDTAYLEIYQFGTSTSSEVTQYLEEFKAANATNILIDLRDNGGGYLTSLEEMGSLFLPVGDVLIQQLTRDGQTLVSKSKGNMVMDFDQIVILINENTASAAEVFTAAIKENREATTRLNHF